MAYTILADICKGCALCKKMCPVSAIHGEPKELHTIDADKCLDCGVCGRACTLNAVVDGLGKVVQKVPRKNWPKPFIHRKECCGCSLCMEFCAKDCLAVSKQSSAGELVFAVLENEKDCVGCGLCAAECPHDAIEMVAGS
ncbi:MAG: 4Fe-4S binding protein [Solirubrobacterales bacterium]